MSEQCPRLVGVPVANWVLRDCQTLLPWDEGSGGGLVFLLLIRREGWIQLWDPLTQTVLRSIQVFSLMRQTTDKWPQCLTLFRGSTLAMLLDCAWRNGDLWTHQILFIDLASHFRICLRLEAKKPLQLLRSNPRSDWLMLRNDDWSLWYRVEAELGPPPANHVTGLTWTEFELPSVLRDIYAVWGAVLLRRDELLLLLMPKAQIMGVCELVLGFWDLASDSFKVEPLSGPPPDLSTAPPFLRVEPPWLYIVNAGGLVCRCHIYQRRWEPPLVQILPDQLPLVDFNVAKVDAGAQDLFILPAAPRNLDRKLLKMSLGVSSLENMAWRCALEGVPGLTTLTHPQLCRLKVPPQKRAQLTKWYHNEKSEKDAVFRAT